jgi:hypothetical protein
MTNQEAINATDQEENVPTTQEIIEVFETLAVSHKELYDSGEGRDKELNGMCYNIFVAAIERLKLPTVPLTSTDGKAIDPQCLVRLRTHLRVARLAERTFTKADNATGGGLAVIASSVADVITRAYATVRGISPAKADAEIRAAEEQEGKQNEGD